MKTLFSISFLFLSLIGLSQQEQILDLPNDRQISPQHAFYIEKVLDKRQVANDVDGRQMIALGTSTDRALLQFYSETILRNQESKGLTLFIKDLSVHSNGADAGKIHMDVDFFFQGQFIYETNLEKGRSSSLKNDVADLAIQAIVEFDYSDVAVMLFESRSSEDELKRIAERKDSSDFQLILDEIEKNRNVRAIGYQIGGLNLIGFDYEFRVSDIFGLHAGVGFIGYTFGLKVHTDKYKDSPFFNFSYKDVGFGLMNTVAGEYGGRLVGRNKGGFGFHYQVGLAHIVQIDETFKNDLFGTENLPPLILSLGIGVSW